MSNIASPDYQLLKSCFLLVLALLLPTQIQAKPAWVTHVSLPGPDQAPIGVSLFDELYQLESGQYVFPYPFESLIDDLEGRLDNNGKSAVKRVLIPIGRSLLRNDSAPDFFRFPRQIISLQGEPIASGKMTSAVLENRLFIAHQPKTQILEVISYNSDMGRFEFQVFDNYDSNQSPSGRYANRQICGSCHQNMGPIFSKQPWSETNLNTEVAYKILEHQVEYKKTLVELLSSDVDVTDILIDRANYISVAQLFWKLGCQTSKCRAAILTAVLQYRLSGSSSFNSLSTQYLEHYFEALKESWSRYWPQGLALANARLENVNPVSKLKKNINQDPLFNRPALVTWKAPTDFLAKAIIVRLADFFTETDIKKISRLILDASEKDRSISRLQAVTDCRTRFENNNELEVVCGDYKNPGNLRATFRIQFQNQSLARIDIIGIETPYDRTIFQPQVKSFIQNNQSISIFTETAVGNIPQRLENGKRISLIKIEGIKPAFDQTSPTRLKLELVNEEKLIDDLINIVLEKNSSMSSDSLSSKPFRRNAILRDMFGKESGSQDNTGLIAVNNTSLNLPTDQLTLPESLQLLDAYCSSCHTSQNQNPPGFLNARNGLKLLNQCVPRINARMLAWQNETKHQVIPMPPPAGFLTEGMTSDVWLLSPAYQQILRGLKTYLSENYPREDINRWQSMPYNQLPECSIYK